MLEHSSGGVHHLAGLLDLNICLSICCLLHGPLCLYHSVLCFFILLLHDCRRASHLCSLGCCDVRSRFRCRFLRYAQLRVGRDQSCLRLLNLSICLRFLELPGMEGHAGHFAPAGCRALSLISVVATHPRLDFLSGGCQNEIAQTGFYIFCCEANN